MKILKFNSILLFFIMYFYSVYSFSQEKLEIDELITGNSYFDDALIDWYYGNHKKLMGETKIAATDQFPWQVSIGISYIASPFDAQFCAGSIYSELWIITAAHCVQNVRPYKIKITVGSNNLENVSSRFGIDRIFIHDSYIDVKKGDDIALIKLKQPLKLSGAIKPIPMELSGKFDSSTKFTVAGWGQTSAAPDSKSAILRFIDNIPYIDLKDCNLPFSYDGKITAKMICAGFKGGVTDSCQGDSGGALVRKENGKYIQSGIVSWGEGCALPMKYGVHTNVAFYTNWIEDCVSSGKNCTSL